MKFDKSLLQRSTDKYVIYARELSSRGTSFLIVLLGVILQASHTTMLMYHVSAFDSAILKGLVSLGIGIFVSMALAVFTLKHDGKNKQIATLINIFFYFEIFTNVFYYFNSILLTKGFENLVLKDWIFFTASMAFAYIMPYTIKQFAGVIAADRSVDFGSIDIVPSDDGENLTEESKNEILQKIDEIEERISELSSMPATEAAQINIDEVKDSIIESLKPEIELAAQTGNTEIDYDLVARKAAESIPTIVESKLSSVKSEVLKKIEEDNVTLFTQLRDKLDERYIKKHSKVVIKNANGSEAAVDIVPQNE